MTRVEVTTCDHCKMNMPWPEVDAGAYGCDLHIKCFIGMSAPQLAQLLGLDDIRVYPTVQARNSNDGIKLNSYVRQHLV